MKKHKARDMGKENLAAAPSFVSFLQHNNGTFYSDSAEIAQAFATQTCEIEMLQQRVRRMEGRA